MSNKTEKEITKTYLENLMQQVKLTEKEQKRIKKTLKIIQREEERKQTQWQEFIQELSIFVKEYQKKVKIYGLEVVLVGARGGNVTKHGECVEIHVSLLEDDNPYVVTIVSAVNVDNEYVLLSGERCPLNKNALMKEVITKVYSDATEEEYLHHFGVVVD